MPPHPCSPCGGGLKISLKVQLLEEQGGAGAAARCGAAKQATYWRRMQGGA